MMADLLGVGEVLGAMITPAVLISASGTLVLSTSNRLGRVVDRIRKLTTEAEELPDGEASLEIVEKRSLIADQVHRLAERLRVLQTTLMTLYTAIGFLVAASLTVGLSASMRGALGWVPVGLGLLGATALMFASAFLVREVRMAVRGTLRELEHIRTVVGRKTTMPVVRNEKPESGQ